MINVPTSQCQILKKFPDNTSCPGNNGRCILACLLTYKMGPCITHRRGCWKGQWYKNVSIDDYFLMQGDIYYHIGPNEYVGFSQWRDGEPVDSPYITVSVRFSENELDEGYSVKWQGNTYLPMCQKPPIQRGNAPNVM